MNLINIPEAARLLDVDRTTVWQWIRRKKLTPSLVVKTHGGKRQQAFLDRADIEALITARSTEVAA